MSAAPPADRGFGIRVRVELDPTGRMQVAHLLAQFHVKASTIAAASAKRAAAGEPTSPAVLLTATTRHPSLVY